MGSLSCLDNLIGIRGVCGTPTAPVSGLYVQDLPFVTMKTADAGMNEDQLSGFELIQNKLNFSKVLIGNDVSNFIFPNMKNPGIVENDTIGYFQENLEQVAAEAGQLKGIEIRIDQYAFLEFYVSSIWLQLQTSVTTNVYVYDLISGKLLDTLSITTIADQPTELVVNKSYTTNKQRLHLIFVIDAGVAGTYKTNIHSTYNVGGNNCSECGGNGSMYNKYIFANGIKITSALSKIQTNLNSNTGTNGMSLIYSLNCIPEPFICTMANQLALPMLYKFGVELMKEFKRSRRLNSVILLHSKDIDELIIDWEKEYMERLKSLLESFELPDNICFYCSPRVATIIRIP